MNKKSALLAAAISGMILTAGCANKTALPAGDTVTGECTGVNSCKGEGSCGANTCSGKSGCQGKDGAKKDAAKKMSQADCEAKGGTFKAN